MKRPKFFLLNLSGIGCRSTRKMVAQSYLSKGHQSRYQILFGSVCIPLEIKCKALVPKGRLTPGDYLFSRNHKPMEQQDFLESVTMNQDFPGKHRFAKRTFSISLKRSRDRH